MAGKSKAEVESQAKIRSEKILELAGQGWHRQKLIEYCILEWGVAMRTSERYIQRAFDMAKTAAHREKEHAFAMHLGRYEKIFKLSSSKFESLTEPEDEEGENDLGFDVNWKVKANLQMTMLQALKYREDLIGLHDKKTNIQVNNNVAKIYDKKNPKSSYAFDIEKLTLAERIELRELIEETRLEPVEGIYPVIFVDPSKYENVIDAEFTLVKEDKDDSLPENVVSKMINIGKEEIIEEPVKKITIQDVKDKIKKSSNEEFLKLLGKSKEPKE